MANLPSDICHEILRSLDDSSLDSCALVNHEFHHIAQEHRFRHVVLDAETWKAKCSFLLSDRGIRLRGWVRMLTINVEEMPLLQVDEEKFSVEVRELGALIRCIGPQLATFRIEGLAEDVHDGELTCTQWSDISNYLCSQILDHIIPSIRSLQLVEIVQLPLLRIMSNAQNLQHLYLTSEYELIGSEDDSEDGMVVTHAMKLDLAIGVFADVDFSPNYSLGRLLKASGNHISTLELRSSLDGSFPNLDFFDPYEDLRANVRHILLGVDLFETIIGANIDEDKFLPHWNFTSLEVLTLTMTTRENYLAWNTWFEWISLCIKSGLFIHTCLRTLQFVVTTDSVRDDIGIPDAHVNFNAIAKISSFRVEFVLSIWEGRMSEQLIRAIRAYLVGWDELEKLTFRVDIGS
ncbi:hypothetical protein DL96DRAFT_1581247 [Flagelloscypha sp. PMI_526]|nr:hypothetical protein DL96DRAFT_1581247 [Flagelloscypha sp. PMI_526]